MQIRRANSCESSNTNSIRRARSGSLLSIMGRDAPTSVFYCSRCSWTFPTPQRHRFADPTQLSKVPKQPQNPINTMPVLSPQPLSAIPPPPCPTHPFPSPAFHTDEVDPDPALARFHELLAQKIQERKSMYGSVHGEDYAPLTVPPSPPPFGLNHEVKFPTGAHFPSGNDLSQKPNCVYKKVMPREKDLSPATHEVGVEKVEGESKDACEGSGCVMEKESDEVTFSKELDLTLKL